MNEIGDAFCPNKECKDYGLQNHGNITVRGKYGKDKAKDCYIVEHAANVLLQREPPHFLDFIYQMKK